MSTAKILSTSALAQSASSLQIKHEKSLGINQMKHWSELDAAFDNLNHLHGADIFTMHNSEPDMRPVPKHLGAVSFLYSDDDSANEEVDYIDDDIENRESPQRLHGTPLLAPNSDFSLQGLRTFVDLSAKSRKAMHVPKASRKAANVQQDRTIAVTDDLGIFANGKHDKYGTDSTIRKGAFRTTKQPAIVHRGLPSTISCPELSPISFRLLCSNEMPKYAARVPSRGSALKHPFRLANKKSPPKGNVEAAVQIFKVDVNLPVLSQINDPKTYRINRVQANGGKSHATTTPAATVNALQCEKYELPPLGELRPHEYWGQESPLEGASRCVTQPPRDYGLIIHLALNRPK
jgi:hypothetical protein